MTRRKLKFWNIPVTAHLDDCLENAVQVDAHVSKSDFVREAVREKLERMGLLPATALLKEEPQPSAN
jgi:Arc/MetJ-type ribon-helix-helix transcriptional regulator